MKVSTLVLLIFSFTYWSISIYWTRNFGEQRGDVLGVLFIIYLCIYMFSLAALKWLEQKRNRKS